MKIPFKALTLVLATVFAPLISQPAQAQTTSNLSAIVEAWLASPHAATESESFRHWDKDGAVPGVCATCHTASGYRDFLASDGKTPGVIDHPALPRATVDCATCHSPAAEVLASVTFPSGVTVDSMGASSRCAVCHQGRESTVKVASTLAGLEEDTPSADLAFINVHYRAAAATLMGSVVKGAFEYDGQTYQGQFTHVPNVDSCVTCHEPHALVVKAETCSTCHAGVEMSAIRTSKTDHDGDGDVVEGIAAEIDGLHQMLGQAMQAYATDAGAPIVYGPGAYPYFFNDSNGNGTADPGEAIYPNRYQAWTPRLLKAAYNYQFVAVDPGAYAHNPHYVIQVLYDSLASLAEKTTVDLTKINR